MIEFAKLFAQSQSIGSLPAIQSRGSKQGENNGDGFASFFQRAAGAGRQEAYKKENDIGIKSAESSGSNLEEDDCPTDEPKKSEKIPDELAALASMSIIQQDTQQIEFTEDDSVQQDAFILESNMDIEAQIPVSGEAVIPVEVSDSADTTAEFKLPEDVEVVAETAVPVEVAETPDNELTARMPQTTAAQETAPEKVETNTSAADGKAAPVTEAGDSCPLENKNDSAQSNTPEDSGQFSGKEEKNIPKSEDTRVFGNQQQVSIAPERIISTESLNSAAEAAPVATATPDSLFATIVESIQMATPESQYMEIQLKPEFLGKVSIQLSLNDAGGMEIKIKAEDMNVKNLIGEQIAQLSESLAEKGTKVTDIDVIYTGVSEDGFYHEQSQSRQQGQQAPGKSYAAGDAASVNFGFGFSDEPELVTMVDAGVSSVEYRA